MNLSLEKKLYWFYLIGFFLIAVLPLLSIPPLFHPPDFAKSIVFRIILSVMLLVFLCQLLFLNSEEFFLKFKNFIFNKKIWDFLAFWVLILFGLIYILATIFSQEPYFSFWGSPFRGGGSLTILFLIAFAVLSFLILKEKGWQRLWDFNILIGIIVSLVAIFQKFALFGNFLQAQTYRPFSTMGGPTFLATYLFLLFFITLSFTLQKIRIKSIFYFISLVFFLTAISATATRSVSLALIIGGLFFLFLYPKKKEPKKISKLLIIKIAAAFLILFSILGAFWLKSQSEIIAKIEQIPIAGDAFSRIWEASQPFFNIKELSFQKIVSQGRYSGWQVLFPALKEKPLLGFGPENISIPFDKNYDPSIPGISSEFAGSGSGWWDRAHNIFLDLALTIGIPGLIIYILFFIVLFIRLQKVKKGKADLKVVALGLQTTFLGYFITNFFNFDTFSTYLILFFLIGYSLFIIQEKENPQEKNKISKPNNSLWKYILATVLTFVFIWFVWSGNINPLIINRDLNIAIFLNDNLKCQKALTAIDFLTTKHSFIDNYIRLKYTDFLSTCIDNNKNLELELSKKAVVILEEAKKTRPTYTRSWLYTAVFLNKIMETDKELTKDQKQELANKAYDNLKITEKLSPKRIELYLTWINTDILMKSFEDAQKRADLCIELNPELSDCYWAKGLVSIASGDLKSKTALEYIKMAAGKANTLDGRRTLAKLIYMYVDLSQKTKDLEYYEILEELYLQKIKFDDNFQNHATLAYIYATLGKYDKAREEAMIVLEMSPESRKNVEAFLDSLPK